MLTDQEIAETFCYQEGDLVSFLGATGRINKISKGYLPEFNFPIQVLMDSGRVCYFTMDGKCFPEQTVAALQIVKLAKPRVKRWQWLYHSRGSDYWRITPMKHTEKEMLATFKDYAYQYRSIPESMIEEDA